MEKKMMGWEEILQNLNLVSRSFALCIPTLEAGLRDQIGLSYLLMRALDSIEDSTLPLDKKDFLFKAFSDALEVPEDLELNIDRLTSVPMQGIKVEEVTFFKSPSFGHVFSSFWSLGLREREIIKKYCLEMRKGMIKFGGDDPFISGINGENFIKSMSLYNEYCYYVAGTVGLLVTELAEIFYQEDLEKGWSDFSLGFGRCLQKTNIIKDHLDDLKKGHCFLPIDFFQSKLRFSSPLKLDWDMALNDIRKEFELARSYLGLLPESFKGLRKFCLLAIIPAYKTIKFGAKHWEDIERGLKPFKISRAEMGECLLFANKVYQGQDSLDNLHNDLFFEGRSF
tara:strand:+ start:7811 stop:8827 length:1017 start_codon:yes stop_codon:yes gene_type:complete